MRPSMHLLAAGRFVLTASLHSAAMSRLISHLFEFEFEYEYENAQVGGGKLLPKTNASAAPVVLSRRTLV